jgi:hypothetical protein
MKRDAQSTACGCSAPVNIPFSISGTLTHCRTRVTVQFPVGEKRNFEILLEQKPVPSFPISVEQQAEHFFTVVVETQQFSLFVLCN